jgi:GNAT superfamily N-acetyltransferase
VETSEDPFFNTVWSALHSTQKHFAIRAGGACKYPADVSPLAAVASGSEADLRDLHRLLAPLEKTHIIGADPPPVPGLVLESTLPCLLMTTDECPDVANVAGVDVVLLSIEDAAEMMELISLAFPGYYRMRTREMGSYYGVRKDGKLIAMAGERIAFEGYREISGVCTHPAHTGNGYAAILIAHLLREQAQKGLRSFLHVAARNQRAIQLYQLLGFTIDREVMFHRLSRID